MISHKWIQNKCVCGCERIGIGEHTKHVKDGVEAKYIQCARPIPVGSMHYHREKEKYKLTRCTGNGDRYHKKNLFV